MTLTMEQFELKLKEIRGGVRIQNCTGKVRQQWHEFRIANYPCLKVRKQLQEMDEKRKKFRQNWLEKSPKK